MVVGTMNRVGVRDLKDHASEILRRVHDDREIIDVTRRGQVIARLIPVPRPVDPETRNRMWDELELLAEKIGKLWPEGLSAADAIAEDRE